MDLAFPIIPHARDGRASSAGLNAQETLQIGLGLSNRKDVDNGHHEDSNGQYGTMSEMRGNMVG